MITLTSISMRRSEKAFWAEFEEARPRILGALLDVVSAALRILPTVSLKESPRMLDFALWATAVEQATGWPAGAFMKAYAGNQDEGHRLALEASPVAKAVVDLIKQKEYWRGTPTELLMELNATGEPSTKLREWPRSPRALSGELHRVVPNLRAVGVIVQFYKADRNTRQISIRRRRSGDAGRLSPGDAK
jgi:hypothetical protein